MISWSLLVCCCHCCCCFCPHQDGVASTRQSRAVRYHHRRPGKELEKAAAVEATGQRLTTVACRGLIPAVTQAKPQVSLWSQAAILIDTSASMATRLFLVKDKLYRLMQASLGRDVLYPPVEPNSNPHLQGKRETENRLLSGGSPSFESADCHNRFPNCRITFLFLAVFFVFKPSGHGAWGSSGIFSAHRFSCRYSYECSTLAFPLFQEQLRHKVKFNLLKFDSRVQAWRDRMVDCNTHVSHPTHQCAHLRLECTVRSCDGYPNNHNIAYTFPC